MVKRDPEPLTERQQEILQAVVELYIETAEPVSSRSLTKKNPDLELSSATVRNAMADLGDLGYLSAPHASAGRVPTPLAFRVYVERLASRGRISAREREIINALAFPGQNTNRDINEVLRDAGRALSAVCQHASFVLLPRLDEVVFSDIEFVPIRDRSVLTVFVAKSGLIQHRVIETDIPLSRAELQHMSNYVKSLLDGKRLADVRRLVVQEMRLERAQADELMRMALRLSERSLPLDDEPGVLVEGESTLFHQPEFADIARMRRLLRAFEEKTVLLRLLDAHAGAPLEAQAAARADTKVVFGVDRNMQEFKDLAVVTASYTTDRGPAGQLGIVGPMRMDYSRVIPLVEMAADALARSFGSENLQPERDNSDEPSHAGSRR